MFCFSSLEIEQVKKLGRSGLKSVDDEDENGDDDVLNQEGKRQGKRERLEENKHRIRKEKKKFFHGQSSLYFFGINRNLFSIAQRSSHIVLLIISAKIKSLH